MVILHRPQQTTIPVFAAGEYYIGRPQNVFGPGGTGLPSVGNELFEEVEDTIGNLTYDDGVETGKVFIDGGG